MKNHKTGISKMMVVLLSGLCVLLGAVVVEAEIICGEPNDVPLCAGQDINVGKVTVHNGTNDLFVTYSIEDPNWILLETHLAVATTLGEIPQTKKGNPKVGQFANSDSFDPCDMVTFFAYQIPLSSFDSNDLVIAAHAVVGWIEEDCIDFEGEEYQEKDAVSIVPTDIGDVNFYMVSSLPLVGLTLGDSADLTPDGNLPIIAEPDTSPPYSNIVAFTTSSSLYRDDYVEHNNGTGAGGKTLTDPQDLSQKPLLYHAYSQNLAILIDATDVDYLQSLSLVSIDLDHSEDWTFQYFDENDELIYTTILSGPVPNGDGGAFSGEFLKS